MTPQQEVAGPVSLVCRLRGAISCTQPSAEQENARADQNPYEDIYTCSQANTSIAVQETASSGSSSALEYIEAISKALEKDPPAEPLVPFTRHRPSVELPRDRATEQELISFKLFDGQRQVLCRFLCLHICSQQGLVLRKRFMTSLPCTCSLQYTDRITDGCYDIWGFVGIEDNTPVAKFPSLDKLASIPFIEGDTREVSLFQLLNCFLG